jgi:hypothetical protein
MGLTVTVVVMFPVGWAFHWLQSISTDHIRIWVRCFLLRVSRSKKSLSKHLAMCLLVFWWDWGLNSELLHTYKAGAHHLSRTSSPFCSGCFGDRGLLNCLPRLASNLCPPGLGFPSSWDYRCEPLVPGLIIKFMCGKALNNLNFRCESYFLFQCFYLKMYIILSLNRKTLYPF